MIIRVVVQVAAGSSEKRLYNEKTLQYEGTRQVSTPYPYPYGFIVDTSSEDGDNIDCYIITRKALEAGEIVECEPIGLLEQFEGDEIDHKVLAAIPGEEVLLDQELYAKLETFIKGVFAPFSDLIVSVGRFLPREAAIQYLQGSFKP